MFRIIQKLSSVSQPSKYLLSAQNHGKNLKFQRWRSHLPFNTVILFVPQQEAWVVERMGRFHAILKPGINILIPVLDRVKYVQSLKEITIDIPKQAAITSDNVNLNIDGVLYLRVINPYNASYGVEDPEFAITQLAQTTMRSEIGKISLDYVFRERESLNVEIVKAINKASEAWGITCLRYEIRDMKLPQRVQDAMQMQVEAERKKRAAILESEGVREAEINVAEGKRKSKILASEAEKLEQINVAQGKAEALQIICEALGHNQGLNAASLTTAQNYIEAFKQLASKNNTMILPANVADISGVVGSAVSIYKTLSRTFEANSNEDNTPRIEGIRQEKNAPQSDKPPSNDLGYIKNIGIETTTPKAIDGSFESPTNY